MGRNKRMDYELIAELYENNYNTVKIGNILETPNGHISKVLRVQGVETRGRGVQVIPVEFNKLTKRLQEMILEDEEVLEGYKRVMGYGSEIERSEVEEKEWKEMTLNEKGKQIVELLESGLSTRKAAKVMGISQSTVVKTRKKYEEYMEDNKVS